MLAGGVQGKRLSDDRHHEKAVIATAAPSLRWIAL